MPLLCPLDCTNSRQHRAPGTVAMCHRMASPCRSAVVVSRCQRMLCQKPRHNTWARASQTLSQSRTTLGRSMSLGPMMYRRHQSPNAILPRVVPGNPPQQVLAICMLALDAPHQVDSLRPILGGEYLFDTALEIDVVWNQCVRNPTSAGSKTTASVCFTHLNGCCTKTS